MSACEICMSVTVVTAIAVVLFGYKITDLLSGMWVLKKSILPRLKLTSYGWDFSEEITLEAIHRPNVKFGEYHIDYYERIGETKLQPFTAGIKNIIFLFSMKLRYLRGR